MCLIILDDTNKPSRDQVLYCVYKTDDHMQEHTPKINNTDIFPTEGHQLPELSKNDEVDQDTFSLGAEDDNYSYDEKACGENSGTES